jgi:hypothetical protein
MVCANQLEYGTPFSRNFCLRSTSRKPEANPYIFFSTSKPLLIVTLFVDDGLACCTSAAKLAEPIKYMELKFEITRSSADLYVGLHIHRDRHYKLVYVNQSIYIKRTLAKFGFSGCTPVSTPADPNIKLDSIPAPHQNVPFSYSGAVGNLQFPQMGSRPDISYE